jgi:hypothetical protein
VGEDLGSETMGVREALVRSVVVSIALGVSLIGCGDGDDGGSAKDGGSLQQSEAATTTTWDDPCADPGSARCEVVWQEQRRSNRRHADRHDFLGDPASAEPTAAIVRDRLGRFAGGSETPSAAAVEDALEGLPAVQTATNAVATAGTAFGVAIDGGCVFGSVHEGEVRVEIGGYVNDGGCLAINGH